MMRLLLTTTLLCFGGRRMPSQAEAAVFVEPPPPCRSNETHIAWMGCPCDRVAPPHSSSEARDLAMATAPAALPYCSCDDHKDDASSSSTLDVQLSSCHWQTHQEAENDAYRYLREHVMDFDLPFLQTLGFDPDAGPSDLPDGLDGGLVGPTIRHALHAKVKYWHTDALPHKIWREYVLNYANVNEARGNWRPYLHTKLSSLVVVPAHDADGASAAVAITETYKSLNTHMWDVLAPKGIDKIVFVGSQTPLIYDPMSVLTYGYASCTGLALLFVCALRSVGIAARLVGTPAWGGKRESGNHNWLEVYRNHTWVFVEPTALVQPDWIDDLDQPPCRRWFCNPQSFLPNPNVTTPVFAARLERQSPPVAHHSTTTNAAPFYRMAWEWESTSVPGEDRTQYYQQVCGSC